MWGRARQTDEYESTSVKVGKKLSPQNVLDDELSSDFTRYTSNWFHYAPSEITRHKFSVETPLWPVVLVYLGTLRLVFLVEVSLTLIWLIYNLLPEDGFLHAINQIFSTFPTVLNEYFPWFFDYPKLSTVLSTSVTLLLSVFGHFFQTYLAKKGNQNSAFKNVKVESDIWLGMGQIQFGCGSSGVSVRNSNGFLYQLSWSRIVGVYDGRKIEASLKRFSRQYVDRFLIENDNWRVEKKGENPLNASRSIDSNALIRAAQQEIVEHLKVTQENNEKSKSIRVRLVDGTVKSSSLRAQELIESDEYDDKNLLWRMLLKMSSALRKRWEKRRGQKPKQVINKRREKVEFRYVDELVVPRSFFQTKDVPSWRDFLQYCWSFKIDQLLKDDMSSFPNLRELKGRSF